MTRVCLYTRISTDEDHQPTSLGTQRERLERYCQAMEDWHIAAAFEDQATGTTLERPGLQAALDLARQGRIELLLVYRVDRLSRKMRQLAAFCEELDQLGVVLKSATEPFDTGSPAGRMMLQMLGVFAEFEHATIVDRVTAGLERRVREGHWMGRRIPYGYTRDPDSKALLPCPVRAPVLRHIFALYTQERQGTTSIARTLEAEGAPPPRQHGWSPNALQVILANPAYLGLIRWNGELYEGQHEPLIEKDIFEQAQQILARRFKDATLRRGNPTPFLLSGLVRCHKCGRAYVGTSAHGRNARYTYYACSTRYKYGRTRCGGQRLSKDRLERAVLAQLATIYRDGQLINDALAQAAEQANTDRPQHEQQLAGVRADIQNLERRIDRYLQAFEDAKLDPDICQQRITLHHARLQALRDQEDQLAQTLTAHADTQPDTASLAALADQLDQLIATANPEQAKELLRLLIKDINVHDQHTIIPTYRVPPAVRTMHGTVGDTGLELASGDQVRPGSPILLAYGALRSAQVRSNCYQNCYQARATLGTGKDRSHASYSSPSSDAISADGSYLSPREASAAALQLGESQDDGYVASAGLDSVVWCYSAGAHSVKSRRASVRTAGSPRMRGPGSPGRGSREGSRPGR
jgi:site-specific DNA recombinase